MRAKLKGHPLIKAGYSQSIFDLAKAINPIIQEWITYYGKFRKSTMSAIYSCINENLLASKAEVQIATAPEMACQPMVAGALSAVSDIVCTLASLEVGG
ncbi:MAG: group II intron maturase-specific domain-containing protein [Methylobacter sp.]